MPKRSTRKALRRLRYKTQKGGRFIKAGTYGCGFRPALRCEGEATRRRGKFAKLVHQTTAADEIVLRTILQPRDPARQYFLYPEAMCMPAPVEASDEMPKCHLKFTAENPARVIIMGKGGENLEELKLRPRDYVPFFESLCNVFRGLAILNFNGLAHMDTKPPNIVTRRRDDGSFHTRLIDFGLMIDPTRLDAWAAIPKGTFGDYDVLDSNYLYWPFEVRFLKPGILDKARTQNIDIQVHLNQFYREFAKVRLSVPYELFGARKLTRAIVSILSSKYTSIAATVPRYAAIIAKADVHGFGVSLAQIYYRFTGHRDTGLAAGPSIAVKASPPPAAADPAKPAPPVIPTRVDALAPSAELSAAAIAWHRALAERVSVPLYALVRDMTNPLFEKRPTMEEALARYEALMPHLAEELTPANITMAIKPWMLDAGVLVEGGSPAAIGGAGAAASSSSEVPPSPVAVPSAPGMLAAMGVPLPESPAHSVRASVMPAIAEANGSEESMVSYVSSSSGPKLFPSREAALQFQVSATTAGSKESEYASATNSEELRQQYENFINSHFVKRY